MKLALTVSFVFLLVLRFVFFLLFGPHLQNDQQVTFTSVILDEPQTTKTQETFTVNLGNVFGSVPVRVITNPTKQFNYQETVKISGTLTEQVLQRGRILFVIRMPDITAIPMGKDKLMQSVIDIRKTIVTSFQNILSKNSATLLSGIVLGVKGEVDSNFKTSLQTTGVMHIVAASGMNVAMVATFFFPFFSKFFRRQYAICLVILTIGWYVLLSGAQPSIIRAGVMIGLALAAQLFGRQYDSMYALFLTAGLMVFFSPSLLFDTGFQLSVGATLGILFIKPLLPKSSYLDDVTTTTAAQLATLPIMLFSFGQYGLLSVVVNFLILWTVPLLMILGGFAAVATFVFSPLANITMYLATPLLWYMISIIDFFGNIGWTIQIDYVPMSLIIGYYLILIAGVWIFSHVLKKKETSKAFKRSQEELNLPLLPLHPPEQ